MNLRKAREIVAKTHILTTNYDSVVEFSIEREFYRGYLEGLADGRKEREKQMKPLVAALQSMTLGLFSTRNAQEIATQALSQWEKMQK